MTDKAEVLSQREVDTILAQLCFKEDYMIRTFIISGLQPLDGMCTIPELKGVSIKAINAVYHRHADSSWNGVLVSEKPAEPSVIIDTSIGEVYVTCPSNWPADSKTMFLTVSYDNTSANDGYYSLRKA